MRTQKALNRFLLGLFVVMAVAVAPLAVVQGQEPPKAGDVYSNNAQQLKLVWCPAEKFTMGSPQGEVDHSDEEAQVEVTFRKGFYLGQTSVTQSQFKSVLRREPWKGNGGVKEGANYPATFVTWTDAASFCATLNYNESAAGRLPAGFTYALPTEAQREYACRAGTTTAYYFGDDPSKLGDYAWWGINAEGNTLPWPPWQSCRAMMFLLHRNPLTDRLKWTRTARIDLTTSG
jgi:formylglycine-generating enzyme required for sulfatase activity